MADVDVRNDRAQSRFSTEMNGAGGELDYREDRGVITFLHTSVDDELEGQGVGSALARAGLDYAREQGLQVVPQCPFVRAYIERHPEYRSLVLTQPR